MGGPEVRRHGVLGDPSPVIGCGEPDQPGGVGIPGATAPGRGPEHRVAALTLAALLFLGGSMGMVNLLERAELVNGLLNIKSVQNQGTVVQVYIPLSEEAADRLRHGRVD